MTEKDIKPIPKYITKLIQKKDIEQCPEQKGLRFYAYLAIWKGELVKATVAVKNHKKQWHLKQVAVQGLNLEKCYVKDMEYCGCIGMGYRVGWYNEGLCNHKKFFEYGDWGYANRKYYDPYAILVNPQVIDKLPEYKYSYYNSYKGRDMLRYLRIYEKYPQAEYLLKMGLENLVENVTILKRIGKDKKFCKWLIQNREKLKAKRYYVCTILKAYAQNMELEYIQKFEEKKKQFERESAFGELKELFCGIKNLEKFFSYLEK